MKVLTIAVNVTDFTEEQILELENEMVDCALVAEAEILGSDVREGTEQEFFAEESFGDDAPAPSKDPENDPNLH